MSPAFAWTHKRCAKCTRKINGMCLAFDKPNEMWKNGGCWGYTESAREVWQNLMDIAEYARKKGTKDVAQYHMAVLEYEDEYALELASEKRS